MIEIYTKPHCNFCVMAKTMLNDIGITFVEHKLDVDFTREILLEKFPTAKTYPVVVIDNFYIGGATELAEHIDNSLHAVSSRILNEGV